MNAQTLVRQILTSAGVELNGPRPFDLQVKDERFYNRVLAQGSLGLGESYLDGWWESEALDELVYRLVRSRATAKLKPNFNLIWQVLRSRFWNLQNRARSAMVARQHYDLGNDLYAAFLDPYNQYTCGYFKDTNDLNQAQENKLDLICRKLDLKPSDRVLDIGCGWGGFAKWAAEHYGCQVTGISISDKQIDYARQFTAGLPVEIKKLDYRDLSGEYDKVLVCGMIEHVGYKNYRRLMQAVRRVLAPDGLFLLHTIGGDLSVTKIDPWLDRYIFPNAMLPSPEQLTRASEGLFVMEDWHNFGVYYDPTLLAWWRNFEEAWPRFQARYGERFYRMFRYYLLSCAGLFRARETELWQIVFSPQGVVGGYQSVR